MTLQIWMLTVFYNQSCIIIPLQWNSSESNSVYYFIATICFTALLQQEALLGKQLHQVLQLLSNTALAWSYSCVFCTKLWFMKVYDSEEAFFIGIWNVQLKLNMHTNFLKIGLGKLETQDGNPLSSCHLHGHCFCTLIGSLYSQESFSGSVC